MRKAVCACLLLLSELPTLRDDYLFSDDYYWFDIQYSRPAAATWEAVMMTVMNGRPVHGLLLLATLPLLEQRATWLVLHGMGVGLLLLLAWSLSRALRDVWSEATADWVATALATLPGFVLFSYWLIAMPCLVAASAGVLACSAALSDTKRSRVAAVLWLMFGLATYQPFALGYFALLGLYAALGRAPRSAFGWGVATVFVYYLLARLSIAAFGFEIAARGELLFAPLAKLRWLLDSALPFAAKLWWSALPPVICGLGLGVLALFLLWCSRADPREAWRRAGWVAACAFMTVLPHLSVRETATRFRTLVPLSLLIALLLCAALARIVPSRWRERLPIAVACLLFGRALELQRWAVLPERALVLSAAHALQALQPQLATSAARLYVTRAGPEDRACGPRLSDDELGAPSSEHDFAVMGIVRLASSLRALPMPRLVQAASWPAARAPVLDLRHVDVASCALWPLSLAAGGGGQ